MTDELKIREILSRIEALHRDVEQLLHQSTPIPTPVPESIPSPRLPSAPQPTPVPPPPREPPHEPSAFEVFMAKVGDWICVRGDFAPKGVTREFAIATRWLVRTGSVILVGAIAYFLMLAIDRGWVGPVQRTYSMMAWGVFGTAFGSWLRAREGRYAVLGEVFAAIGLAGLYLAFGLGHRHFRPPVIASPYVAFGGLVVATIAAGVMSVRFRSPMIAILALGGGFLVPGIVPVRDVVWQFEGYLTMLSIGGVAIALCRRWTPLGFATLATSFVMFDTAGLSGRHPVPFVSAIAALALALTMLGAKERRDGANGFCWAFVALALVVWGYIGVGEIRILNVWRHFAAATGVLSTLAWGVRRCRWANGIGAPVLITFAVLYAAISIANALDCHHDWFIPAFCAFAALLAELGVRTRERTLQVLSLVMFSLLVWVFVFKATADYYCYYYSRLAYRIRDIWCVPAALAYASWRLTGKGAWMERLRVPFGLFAFALAMVVVSCESRIFGNCHLPSLGHGLITIVWAIVASALLTGGIVRRQKVIRVVGLCLLGMAIAKLLLIDTASLPVLSRVATFAAVGILLIAGAFLYLKFRSRFEENS